MADIIAKIMMVVGPLAVAIGVVVFIIKNREQWNQEIEALQKK